MVQFGFLSAYDLLDLYMYFKKVMQTNVIEINHWAKVANKTANINVQNRSLNAS